MRKHFIKQFLCFVTGIFAICITGCNSAETKQAKMKEAGTGPGETKTTYRSAPTDTIIIDKPAAVFFTPDSVQRENIKKQFTAAQYDGMDHECFYQMKNARTSLKEHWPQIKIYEVMGTVYLQYLMPDGRKAGLDLREKKDLCGLILFRPGKEPVPADMASIGTSLENYFLH